MGLLLMASCATLMLENTNCGDSAHGGFDIEGGASRNDGGVPVLLRDGSSAEGAANKVDSCHVPPGSASGNAPTCTAPPAPPSSFEPVLKWTWNEPASLVAEGEATTTGYYGSTITPLVAEMVDTNGDGQVDLCDIPSVIVTLNPNLTPTSAGSFIPAPGYIYMLSGDKGEVQAAFEGQVDGSVTPALGDIDGDGFSEVVTNDLEGHLVVYDHTGHIKWSSPQVLEFYADYYQYCGAIAIYDLDGDGKPEIIEGFEVLDNAGHHLWSVDESMWDGQYYCPAMTAADLDGDGVPEVIFGNGAYHRDGSVYWTIDGPPGQPQVADFDGDGLPEVFIARQDGLMVVSHDGQTIIAPTQSFDPGPSANCWSKAGAVGDFDGTGHASIMDGSCAHFGIWHVGASSLSLLWDQPIDDPSGVASSTAFDLLGRGITDAVYGDQANLWVYNGKTGGLELKGNRSSGTLIEYPVIADVDNDGSSDIVVVSNTCNICTSELGIGVYPNTVEVFEEREKRWAPSRRIWNQHAYHVTNVNEDGTIPRHMAPSWKYLNTFRMNAQIQSGGDCAPPPANPK
jgi:hypothetical protein